MLSFKRIIWIFIAVFSLVFSSCKEDAKKTISTQEIEFTHEGNLNVYSNTSDTLKTKFDIEFAETDYETQTGLMYRKGMKNNQAMLFIFPDEAIHSFYMKNTEFSLDIIYIKEDMTIASMQENAQPFNEASLSSMAPIKYVLEINGGLAETLGISIGDRISFSRN
ncbi:hypothetical protein SAMN04488008_103185 [Maribacter orientalis]|uniref:DUF192 domain-containing protein n=1 Tax=Maribacter orientalis TaxID=228957 RepID=A0A1H7NH87_9FLAO|nr:DUF192 domain-containing protein [Maribacter orientalis]SEL22902.1 hypothetical protein SAMN04488008_103185 [Maribacter orientalis]